MSPPPTKATDVLIVGAGPTGLVLALSLSRLGVAIRIIDPVLEPGTTSRALAVQARTLELYRQVGLADDVLQRGLRFTGINLWARGTHQARADFSDIGQGVSPFPFITMFPQDQHERLLIEHLRRAGVEVERGTRLESFEQPADGVVARLVGPDGAASECSAAYIAGCDGGHSKVREGLGIGFPGGTYDRVFYVADVELSGPTSNDELHIALEADFLAVFPMKGDGAARLVGTVKEESEAKRRDLTWNDVSHEAVDRMKVTVERLHWFSTYRVHHRVAERFRSGRGFILGDAAHVHSPVGGQGMNTGIGDAINLSWKLAAVLQHRAETQLLESYEPERIAFARRLVATTDRAFTVASGEGAFARAMRIHGMPLLVSRLTRRASVRRFLFRTVSQTAVTYHKVHLNEGTAGGVRGGDRLPWVPAESAGGEDNFAPLASLDWQVHVHGVASPELTAACRRRGLPLHVFPWTPKASEAGLAEHAAYFVRPDGYVGLADPAGSADTLDAYIEKRELRFRS
jgi:2-polyprenyl-6-methoxyphenol hydroxylase-like FAD-dependent oxidoreductase